MHDRRSSKCKVCVTRSCPHSPDIYNCPACSPTERKIRCARCLHMADKHRCRTCSPHLFCKHEVRSRECPQCTTRGCDHSANIFGCPTCSPSERRRLRRRCAHKANKYECLACSPHLFCECGVPTRRCIEHRT
jgi:hypothetical protein